MTKAKDSAESNPTAPNLAVVDVPLTAKRQSARRGKAIAAPPVEEWAPPNFRNELRTRIGASFVDQFVAGHQASDVLRELVQNEFDGGGSRLTITFGEAALDVVGSGRKIGPDGWKRLSVIIGTGRVVGDDAGERVAAKINGIGSKNFGLRSLFLFGDQIYVRSAGRVALLELPTLQTGQVSDPTWRGEAGVRLKVPYRDRVFGKLEPFTLDEERRVLETMAGGMLATLVKLALAGQTPGLRELTLHSVRTHRMLSWQQSTKVEKCRVPGVSMLRRIGRLKDQTNGELTNSQNFEELEFVRSVPLPTQFRDALFPSYYRRPNGRIAVAVSLPVARNSIDFSRLGNFYYPLQAPDARTGNLLSVSAPFDADSDRSSLLDNSWNRWLIEQAVSLIFDLLKGDWFNRFQADAFRAIAPIGPASPNDFADGIKRRLSDDACWPTRAKKRQDRLVNASDLVLPSDPQLDGYLGDRRHLASSLQANETVRTLAAQSGASRFTLASLVRLRCAADSNKKLETKVPQGESDYHFTDYVSALSGSDLQAKMGTSLTAHFRALSKANRADLRNSPSTLSAVDELKPAKDLVVVDPAIWEVCPEPKHNRLHPSLVGHRAIATLCQKFDEQAWILAAVNRAKSGTISDEERKILWKKLLADGAKFSRPAMAALRESPVALNQRGEWTAPAKMVQLKGNRREFR